MKYYYSCQTDIGIKRPVNEDAIMVKTARIKNHTIVLAAVCDGVGGLTKGDITSRKALTMMSAWLDAELPQLIGDSFDLRTIKYRLQNMVLEINSEVYLENVRTKIKSGTTLSAILICDDTYVITHVGDSRIYKIDHDLSQVTEDHSLVAEELRAGYITSDEALKSKESNVILRCIGSDANIELYATSGVIREDTGFVLCSDGFWHHITNEELYQSFKPKYDIDASHLGQALYELTELAKTRGETDNISAIALAFICRK